jgi:hypothetical protein
MANVKITDLTAGSAVSASDPFESVQSGVSVQVTADQIKAYTNIAPSVSVTNALPFFATYPLLGALAGGTDSACANGNIFWASVYIPHSITLTGIGYLTGSVAGTDKVIVALYDNAGALLANSALAGATVTGTNNIQQVAFTAPENVLGPNYFYVAVQFNGTTAKFRTIAGGEGSEYLSVTNSSAGTFGTLGAIVTGGVFTSNQGPIAYTY